MSVFAPALPLTIAIDGPAASGKSVLAERLAARLGYFYLDTGLMYRAVTHAALERGIPVDDEPRVAVLAAEIVVNVAPAAGHNALVTVDGVDVSSRLHRDEVDDAVSAVSSYAGVRQAMTDQQRRIAARGRVILAGRDIGTVVLPDAACKIYLTATLDARAHRRLADCLARGESATLEQMRETLARRDQLDSTRALAPLSAAADAVPLDNSDLTIEDTVARALAIIQDHAPRALEG